MRGRRSVWSDLQVQALAEQFVTASDEVWRLQRGSDPESRFFQKMAHQGHYGSGGGTKQGIYVCAASGEFLASVNSLNPKTVKDMLTDALQKWAALPEERRHLSADAKIEPRGRWEKFYPYSGLVLSSISRDLPKGARPGSTEPGAHNRDHAWFSESEAQRWLPERLEVGAVIEVPKDLSERMMRFHLVDSVLGQTLPFARGEVSGEIRATVTAVSGDSVEIRIEGHSHAESDGEWLLGDNDWRPRDGGSYPRGMDTQLLGYASYDLRDRRFTRFDLLARGRRWGYTQFNGRRKQSEPSEVAFCFELAGEDGAARVPPAFIDIYDAPWVRK